MTRPTFALSASEGLRSSQAYAHLNAEQQLGFHPVQYQNQYLPGYHWWLFPNYVDGIYSKVYARVNIVGALVCGTGEATHLVCIENGRFTLSSHITDTAVSSSDERLLVCL